VVGEDALAGKLAGLRPHLDERQWRLLLGAEATAWGKGGIAVVARASGVSRTTVRVGVSEFASGEVSDGRVRRAGAGRPSTEHTHPGLTEALDALVDPETRGDPESPLRWTSKSLRSLVDALAGKGFTISEWTVARLLRAAGYRLQANAKTKEGTQHPDRDAQFRYLNNQATTFLAEGQPVISVDTKKKEIVGEYKNNGREWQPTGDPVTVNVHDFPDKTLGKAVPYGIYDLGDNTGWVSVGCDHDTAAFAVATIERWWQQAGRVKYPQADRLLISADCGGSNSYRTRAWKTELATFAARAGITVTVCHLPPGTSKWNKIEHRLFSHISINWRGRPLTSHEVIVELIGNTRTATGLTVHAEPDTSAYPTGVKISNAELAAVPLTRHDWHGEWNYTIHPNHDPTIT
jgi:hypothetical protein